MARISMRNVQKSTVEEYFDLYPSSAAAKGIKDKALETYKHHFFLYCLILPEKPMFFRGFLTLMLPEGTFLLPIVGLHDRMIPNRKGLANYNEQREFK